jgi:hypothetical protein
LNIIGGLCLASIYRIVCACSTGASTFTVLINNIYNTKPMDLQRNIISWAIGKNQGDGLTSIYKPLVVENSEIRLLQLHAPFSEKGPVRCTLSTISLTVEPNFVALSYVWGDASITEDIIVDGVLVPVTVNLAMALRQIGSKQGGTVLWADAVCINQNDVDERNHQVALMGTLYSQATSVISWIGPSDETSSCGIKLLRRLAHVWSERLEGKNPHDQEGLDLDKVSGWDNLWRELEAGLPSLFQLFKRPYWTRVWVFQEMALATRLVCLCGSETFTEKDIFHANLLMLKVSKTPGLVDTATMLMISEGSLIGYAVMQLLGNTFRNDTAQILLTARKLQATNPRDHIYGLQALMDTAIKPDYNMSPRDVYCSFASSWITESRRLDVLMFAGLVMSGHDPAAMAMPTWVPNWEVITSITEPLISFREFRASVSTNAEVRVSPDITTIWPQGVLCDKVRKRIIIDTDPIDMGLSEMADYFWAMVLNSDINPYPTGTSRLESVFWLIFYQEHSKLHSDMTILSTGVVKFLLFLCTSTRIREMLLQLPAEEFDEQVNGMQDLDSQVMKDFLKLWLRFERSSPYSSTMRLEFQIDRLQHLLERNSTGQDPILQELFFGTARRMPQLSAFHTTKGYLGYGPQCLAPDDIICVLTGQDCPVILRPVDSYYILIGECIVIGLMEGEAILEVEDGKAVYQEFEIR